MPGRYGMKQKKYTMGSRTGMDLLELAHHLRQEYLFVSSERQHLQCLNEKVMKTVEHLYHLSWIAKQQRINLENLILARPDSHPAACCQYANALEGVNFIDSYKTLGIQDNSHAEFLQQFREDPKLVAMCLAFGEKLNVEQMQNIVHIVMSSIYGNSIIPEDEVYVLKLLKELMSLQLANSDNPRRLLRHGSCAFSRVYKTFNEGLFAAKLFLTAALHEPIMHLLMEDDLFLDIDPDKAVVRFPPHERLRHFGKEGTQEYLSRLQKYRSWTICKLVNLTMNFIEGIRNNMYCFPQSLSWLVRQMYNLVMKAKRVEVREVGAMCADLVFAFFICPAIVNPEPYGITDAPISHIARFNLMQVAQILQVLAMTKWEEIDPKLMDLYGKFEKNCMSSLLDLILEGSAEDSPNDLVSQFHELVRSAILITESELVQVISFLRGIEIESTDETLKKSLTSLLSGFPVATYGTNFNQNCSTPHSHTPNATPVDTPPHTPSTKRNLLGKVSRKSSKPAGVAFSESHIDDHNINQDRESPVTITTQIEDVLVVPLASMDFECPGMLCEEKVLSLEQQKKHNRVRMNLDSLGGEEVESVTSGPEIIEKKTRFSLSQDQESIGTSDNLEAISEAASNHSVASSLDLENENENDNLSDMVSANVSGRGTPNVSGRDTPSSQIEGEEREEREQRPLDLPVSTQKQNRDDIEDKFGRFEIKQLNEGDETKSMVSDTWSTDVLASDSETVEQSDISSQMALEVQPPGLLDISETASQSDAWSTDVLTSDTERLQDLDTDDTASVARSDDTARSEVEGDVARTERRESTEDGDLLNGVDEASRIYDFGSNHGIGIPSRMASVVNDSGSLNASLLSSSQIHVLPSSGRNADLPTTKSGNEGIIQQHPCDMLNMKREVELRHCVVNGDDMLRLFDPLSVETDQNEHITVNQDDLTPTSNCLAYTPQSQTSGKMSHLIMEQENRITMQSLGRLSLAVRELPDNDNQDSVASLLDSLQESAGYDAQSGTQSERHRSSIADILSLDLNKTLNLTNDSSSYTPTDIIKSNSDNSLEDFDLEMLDMEIKSATPVNSNSGNGLLKTDQCPRVSGSENSAKNSVVNQKIQDISEDLTSRLSSASISSTSSSSCSTDICLKSSNNSDAVTSIEDKKCIPSVETSSLDIQKNQMFLSSVPSTGAIPKSATCDKASTRIKDMESEDKSGDKNRKSFFKLSSFKFNFKVRNRKSHPSERQEQMHRSNERAGLGDRCLLDKDKISYRQLQRTCSEDVCSSHLETGDEILAKYRKKTSSSLENSTVSAVDHVDTLPNNLSDSNLPDEESHVFDPVGTENSFAFADAKRKLRLVLGSADTQTMPWLTHCPARSFPGGSGIQKMRDNDLVAFLNVLLAEAINLQQHPLMAHLHEALRCVKMFDDVGCQKLFRSLKDDYKSRAPYIAYLVRCRQGLLSTLAHLETLTERIERDKLVCNRYLITLCVRAFLEKKERTIELFLRKFQALTVSDEKAHLVEKFLQYLFSNMEIDPTWHAASEHQLEYARSVIERTIMSQIYIHAMYPNGDGDKLRDQILHQHMQKLSSVITPTHKDLRISKVYHHECPWPSAQAEIFTINAFKTPRDKIQCVLKCCNTIMNLLSMARDKSIPAADDFMPVFVFVLIKANPSSLLSTVQYVNTFYDKHLEGEESYWWTQFCSAVEFIKTMDY